MRCSKKTWKVLPLSSINVELPVRLDLVTRLFGHGRFSKILALWEFPAEFPHWEPAIGGVFHRGSVAAHSNPVRLGRAP